jgi:polyketide cyclase/dehydrase/lipid transport protein
VIGTRYRFRTVWRVPAAPPAAVFAVLERAEEYPSWWPQVREARRLDADTGVARFRSLLPFELRVTVREARRDPAAGVIEAYMSGDLRGLTRWTVLPDGDGDGDGGAVAVHEQDVEVARPLLRLLSVPGRPLLLANHALMMRAGARGLRRHLRSGLDEA